MTEQYDWNYFKSSINQTNRSVEAQAKELLDLVSDVDLAVQRVVDRQTSYASERPQDYVVSILIVRSFRLFISTIILGASGYADIVPNLGRSIMEIGLLLLEIRSNPVPTSLGYMLHSAQEEIITMETELGRSRAKGADVLNLPTNLEEWRHFHSDLASLARDKGLCAEEIERSFARTSIRSLCKRHGIEEYYLVNYKFSSLFTHCLHASLDGVIVEDQTRREFVLSPVDYHGDAALMDSFAQMITNLVLAGEILEDDDVGQMGTSLSQKVETIIISTRSRTKEA
jgi:hypothetical protein